MKAFQPGRRTLLLGLLVIIAAIACFSGWKALTDTRAAAEVSRRDLGLCTIELAAMTSKSPATGREKSSPGDDAAINRQLRSAAIAAGLSEQLSSIDPGPATRVRDTDYTQTPIYVHLNAATLQQLVGFLYELSITDHSLRTSDIELALPLVAVPRRQDLSDVWAADLTISYLEYAPRQSQPAESR